MANKIRSKAILTFIFSTIFCCSSQSVLAASSMTPSNKIAIGTYAYSIDQCPLGNCGKSIIEQPMMLTSDNINSWKFKNFISDFKHGGDLYQVNCSGKTCVASGAIENESYNGENHKRRPLFMISKDDAQSWSLIKNIDGLPEMTDGAAPSLSCINEYCSAAGSYQYGDHTFPLLLTSQDYGASWVNVKNIENLSEMESLSAITCTDNFCIAGASYTKNYDKNLPLLITSKDHGQSWTIIKNIIDAPKMQSVNIKKIKCFNGVCVAVGNYDSIHPLVLVSHDQGQSWKFINNLLNDIPDSDRTSLSLEDIAYSNGSMILVGGVIFESPGSSSFSLILVSSDQGKSWSLMKDDHIWGAWLKSISCNNNTCVTGGDAARPGHGAESKLTLFISKDNGQSWLRPSINLGDAPDIEMVQCDEKQCIAMGHIVSWPISIVSVDQGKSWSQQKIAGYPYWDSIGVHFTSMT
jgi:photosystem II stability/assembly factor-like uncharacterized protein